jgi:competence protein ComEA
VSIEAKTLAGVIVGVLAVTAGVARLGSKTSEPMTTLARSKVQVHISGGVHKPGRYELASTARLADAISAAGGLKSADSANLNLAERLVDGAKYDIPIVTPSDSGARSAPAADAEVARSEARSTPAEDQTSAAVPPVLPPVLPSDPSEQVGRVSVNSASQMELEQVPGIGPKLAMSIIQFREEKLGVRALDELREVPGLSEKVYLQIEPYLTL